MKKVQGQNEDPSPSNLSGKKGTVQEEYECHSNPPLENEDVGSNNSENEHNSRSSGAGKFFWVLVIVACVILGVRVASKITPPSGPRPVPPVVVNPPTPNQADVDDLRKQRQAEQKLKLETEKLRADIAARHSKFKSDVNAIYEKYRKMLPLSEADDHFKVAEQGTDFIASKDGLCGWKVCATLAYKMAYDKVKHTNRAEEAILPIVTCRIVEPITNAVSVYSKWTTEFRQEIQKEDMAFAMDLAMRSHQFNETISVLTAVAATNVSSSVDKFIVEIQNYAKESTLVGVGAMVELAIIKSSYAVVKKLVMNIVTVSLSAVAKKMVGTAAASATSAVADGPLPFGDVAAGVITIGGLIWTSVDIYNVTKSMPDEMKAGIMNSIKETRKSLVDTSVECLKSDHDACIESAEKRVVELYNLIK